MSDDRRPSGGDDTTNVYVRNTAVMTAGTILSRATGLVRVAAIAYALGVLTPVAAAYLTANTAPNILYELVLGGILTSVFLPVFVGWRHDHGRTEAWQVADRAFTFAGIALVAVALIGIVLAPEIVRFYRIRDPAQAELATFLLRWFMPQAVFYGIGAIAGGVLNAEGRFAAPMFAPVLNNLAVIAALIAVASIGLDEAGSVDDLTGAQRLLLGAGTTFGVVAMTMALWPSLRAAGYRWRPRLDLRHPAVRRLVQLSTWVLVYVAANQVAYALIVRYTNDLDDARGKIAAYNIGFLIFSLPHAVFAVSVITALLPAMADRWAAGDRAGVIRSFSRGLRDTSVVMLPAAFGLAALALPISRLLLERGLTGTTDVVVVGDVLLAFAVGLPFFSAFQLLTRTFYAMQDSRTPALTNVVSAVVQVAASLTYAFVLDLDVQGMAFGHATSYAVGTAILLVRLRSAAGRLDGRRIAATLIRVVPVAVVTAAAAYAVAETLGAHGPSPSVGAQLAQVVAAVLTGMLVFAGLASIVGVREVRDIAATLRRRFRG
ncbi:MAG TPA: murein biosynthesis integral membrane protein MurJ [Actinomycetota bacterium]|nr:murein biosynthesis integral membrane protein MurJ [Actinomycetota bacterium]